jgi:hypothetical protein
VKRNRRKRGLEVGTKSKSKGWDDGHNRRITLEKKEITEDDWITFCSVLADKGIIDELYPFNEAGCPNTKVVSDYRLVYIHKMLY